MTDKKNENNMVSLNSFRKLKEKEAQKYEKEAAPKEIPATKDKPTESIAKADTQELLTLFFNHYEFLKREKADGTVIPRNIIPTVLTRLSKEELYHFGNHISTTMNFNVQNSPDKGLYSYLKAMGITFLYKVKEEWVMDNISIEIEDRDNVIFYLPQETFTNVTLINILVLFGFFVLHLKCGTTGFGVFPLHNKEDVAGDNLLKHMWMEALYFALGFFIDINEFKLDFLDDMSTEDFLEKYFIDNNTFVLLKELHDDFLLKKD